MWGIPQAITEALKVIAQWMYLKSPEQQSKKIDNDERRAREAAESKWKEFKSRMRLKYMGKRCVAALALTYLASCTTLIREPVEYKLLQEQLEKCQQSYEDVLNDLIECQDIGDSRKCSYAATCF